MLTEKQLKKIAEKIKEIKMHDGSKHIKGWAYIKDNRIYTNPRQYGLDYKSWGDVRKRKNLMEDLLKDGVWIYYIFSKPKIKVWEAKPQYYFKNYKKNNVKVSNTGQQ